MTPFSNRISSDDPCDVSIIIPMYKSRKYIRHQILHWDLTADGLKKEIIYVDDACPQKSHQAVTSSWKERPLHENGITTKLLLSPTNRGYAGACNLGASHATGNYLLFLNADTVPQKNWVRPMWEICESDPNIGIVGNLQLKETSAGLVIDSAGSEWDPGKRHFQHIGRNIYHGKMLKVPIPFNEIPEDLLVAGERHPVTGCCFIIPRKLFEMIGGYDEQYQIAYWEDVDMNMAVRKKGYKIYYEPRSCIFHAGGHSGATRHPFLKKNHLLFCERWVHSGFVNSFAQSVRGHHE